MEGGREVMRRVGIVDVTPGRAKCDWLKQKVWCVCGKIGEDLGVVLEVAAAVRQGRRDKV